MPYLVVGFVLYLLYRHYSNPEAAAASAKQPAANGQDVQPVNNADNTNPPPSPSPGDSTGPVTWKELPEGSQMQPGSVYRASAPPQGALVMMMISSTLTGRGFTDVQIYKPGSAFPNDWPDSGDLLRIEATLPEGAQPQTFELQGVRVWQQMPTQTVGDIFRAFVKTVRATEDNVRHHVAAVVPSHPHPKDFGVYSGLVRRPPPQ